jgi:hypothetical protein
MEGQPGEDRLGGGSRGERGRDAVGNAGGKSRGDGSKRLGGPAAALVSGPANEGPKPGRGPNGAEPPGASGGPDPGAARAGIAGRGYTD